MISIVKSIIHILPYVIFIVALILLITHILFSKGNFFDVNIVVKEYVNIFKTKSAKKFMFVIFLLITVLSASIAYIKVMDKNLIDSVTLIISVLTAAFLGFIPIVATIQKKSEVVVKIKKETNSLLMFQILLSTIILVLCFAYMFIMPENIDSIVNEKICFFKVFSFIIYDMVFTLLIHVLILLKRIGLLLNV